MPVFGRFDASDWGVTFADGFSVGLRSLGETCFLFITNESSDNRLGFPAAFGPVPEHIEEC